MPGQPTHTTTQTATPAIPGSVTPAQDNAPDQGPANSEISELVATIRSHLKTLNWPGTSLTWHEVLQIRNALPPHQQNTPLNAQAFHIAGIITNHGQPLRMPGGARTKTPKTTKTCGTASTTTEANNPTTNNSHQHPPTTHNTPQTPHPHPDLDFGPSDLDFGLDPGFDPFDLDLGLAPGFDPGFDPFDFDPSDLDLGFGGGEDDLYDGRDGVGREGDLLSEDEADVDWEGGLFGGDEDGVSGGPDDPESLGVLPAAGSTRLALPGSDYQTRLPAGAVDDFLTAAFALTETDVSSPPPASVTLFLPASGEARTQLDALADVGWTNSPTQSTWAHTGIAPLRADQTLALFQTIHRAVNQENQLPTCGSVWDYVARHHAIKLTVQHIQNLRFDYQQADGAELLNPTPAGDTAAAI
ncbi:hypothetical protein ACIOWI_37190, partial [Streptomyces sp. NPDC087659]|uniref:hypothetical protein n=1 Tax=Streptomyces sp. NPDC087659 TaxID=3365801 RepID=UPI0037FF6921